MNERAARGEHLERLYTAVLRLIAIVETAGSGAVAHAGRDAQQDLWPVIQSLGGSQEDFVRWQEGRRDRTRRAAEEDEAARRKNLHRPPR